MPGSIIPGKSFGLEEFVSEPIFLYKTILPVRYKKLIIYPITAGCGKSVLWYISFPLPT